MTTTGHARPLTNPRPCRCRTLWRCTLASLLAQGLTACAPVPVQVQAPPALPVPVPVPATFREPLRELASPTDPTAPTPMPADGWWQVLADPQLDAWMQRALRDNPGLQQATARVDRAAAVWQQAGAQQRPQLGASITATRQQGALVNAAGGQGNLFNAEALLRHDLDLLGQLSRQQQSALHDLHDLRAAEALQRQARLLLQAELADSWLAWRTLALEQRTQQAVLQLDHQLLAIAERRVAAGLAAAPLRSAAQADLADDTAQAQTLARRSALLGHALAALAGGYDAPLPAPTPALAHTWPAPLPAIPPGLPATLLQRRPDVAAADQALQAARLRLGLARDAWFPSLSLTANASLASGELGQWLQMSARNLGLGLVLSLPGLDGGRADAQRAAAAAALQDATAEHRAKVVQALREVDDQLATLRTLADEAQARDSAAATAAAEAERSTRLWQRGLSAEADALQARRAALRQQRLALQLQGQRRQATVGLVRALGGDWGDAPVAAEAAPLHTAAR